MVEDDRIVPVVSAIDAVWLGVDQYTDTAFVNKVGSRTIVEACTRHNIPVFVLGDSRKRVATLAYTDTLFERVPFTSVVQLITEAPCSRNQ
jgi:translation initiation factor 2B subunit (eIF-2B alpha/beta/delta family)